MHYGKLDEFLQKETKTQLRSVVGKTINHKNRWDGKNFRQWNKNERDKEAQKRKFI